MTGITRSFASGCIALILLSACTSTQLVQRWHDPEYPGSKLQKILVLGVFKDDTRRRSFEQAFTDQLNASGRHAVAGYSLVPDAADIGSREAVVAAVQKAGADAVLITHFKGESTQQRNVPPRVDYVPTMGIGYYGYYAPVYRAVYQPGYTVVDKIVKLETRVYALSNEKLVWAGNSESVNASSSDRVIQELAGLVATDMKKHGLID